MEPSASALDRSGWNAATQRGLKFVILLMALAGLYRVYTRGIPGAIQDSPDLRPPYLSACAWGRGADPYSESQQRKDWRRIAPASEPELPDHYWYNETPLYPPPTLALLYPLTFIPWGATRVLWLVMNLVLSAAAWMALTRMLAMPWFGWKAALLGALWLSLGPFITCMHLANPTFPAVNLLILAICLASDHRDMAAGLLLGVAITLKPQVAAALLPVYVLQPRHRVWLIGLCVALFFAVIGVGRLWLARVDWVSSLGANVHWVTRAGGFNDPTVANSARWQLVNLQIPLSALFASPGLVGALAWLAVALLAGLYLFAFRRARGAVDPALAASVPLILCLLPVYHRYYDTLVLAIPLAWAIAALGGRLHRYAIAVIACTLPFYVSTGYVLSEMQARGRIPDALARSALWNALLIPGQTWTLIALALLLMHLIAHGRAAGENALAPKHSPLQLTAE